MTPTPDTPLELQTMHHEQFEGILKDLHAVADALEAEVRAQCAHAQAQDQEIAELRDNLAWIRRCIGVPEDAQMFSGNETIAGRLHVMVGGKRALDTLTPMWEREKSELKADLAALRTQHAALVEDLYGVLEKPAIKAALARLQDGGKA